jgi:hypothetical protein
VADKEENEALVITEISQEDLKENKKEDRKTCLIMLKR